MKAFKGEKRAASFGSVAPIRTGYLNRPGLEKKVMAERKTVSRTSAGLRDALFDCIERVRDGEMAPEDAQAISNLAKGICASVQLEINVAKLRTEYPADAKLIIPSPLKLGSDEPDGQKT